MAQPTADVVIDHTINRTIIKHCKNEDKVWVELRCQNWYGKSGGLHGDRADYVCLYDHTYPQDDAIKQIITNAHLIVINDLVTYNSTEDEYMNDNLSRYIGWGYYYKKYYNISNVYLAYDWYDVKEMIPPEDRLIIL
jgi:hypothetical protein